MSAPMASGEFATALKAVADAVRSAELAADDAVDAINKYIPDYQHDDAWEHLRKVQHAVRLLRTMYYLTLSADMKSVHDAYGAPGSWGYETELGAALYRLYSVKAGAK